ncbi:hypothetical protein BASA81_010170 [Batrachochytrium salamandrivorans]|nr:hypothetical protein BASA81_010170 [Batrachochytrium salamandrivorans]
MLASQPFRFDALLGRAVSSALANLFETVSASLEAMIAPANFAKIQDLLVRFLFDPGFQEINVRVVEDASKVTIRHDCANSQSTYPIVNNIGDIDVLSQFFPTRMTDKQSTVNTLDTYFTMCGMPSIALIVHHLRKVIQLFSSTPSVFASGEQFLQELKHTLPYTFLFASNIVDMKTVRLDIAPSPAVSGCKLVVLVAEVDSIKLQHKYPSLANLLKHLAQLDLSLVEGASAGAKTGAAMVDKELSGMPCMMQLKINYLRGGAIEIKITLMLGPNDTLAWFSKPTQQPHNGQFRAIEFRQDECEYETKFWVVIDGAFRIPQLGCAGSIALPLLVCELKCLNSKSKFPTTVGLGGELHPAARFDISILHMAESRLTAMLLRPFFNLDLLRFVLVHHFHIQFEVAPLEPHPTAPQQPTKDGIFNSDTVFYDAEAAVVVELEVERRHSLPKVHYNAPPWTIASKVHMLLPIPPKTVTSCLSLFVGEQIASPDNLVMLIDLTAALSKDLKEMSARLARAEGDHATAITLERELQEEAVIYNKRQDAIPHKKSQSLWAKLTRWFT